VLPLYLVNKVEYIFIHSSEIQSTIATITRLPPPKKEVMILGPSVCLSAIAKKLRTLTKYAERVGHGPGRNCLDFGGDPDSFVDSRLSRILYHRQIHGVGPKCKLCGNV